MTFPSKEMALDALEQTRVDYLWGARMYAAMLARTQEYVTVDDVRVFWPPPPNIDPRVMGAIFRTNDWEHGGYVNSTRATCHKRPIAQFRRKVS